jgi:TatD DNase family protein
MTIIDTHCHIHDSEYYTDNREEVYRQSVDAGVVMLCVGTDLRSSEEAVEFAKSHEHARAIVGVHPHEAKEGIAGIRELIEANHEIIVGIGEIGLDYFYTHSSKAEQVTALRGQLELAKMYDLPVSFHVRSAFEDFWPIYDEFAGQKGVLHSFTDTYEHYLTAIKRGLYIGVNGISTFTKDEQQQKLFTEIPLASIVLETDAPFLTPSPLRGKINLPAYVGRVAEHQAMLKGVSFDVVVDTTNHNAKQLFNLN